MTRLCNTHPGIPAQWECKQCNIAWCKDCIETHTIQAYGIGNGQRAQCYCPSCSRPVRKIACSRQKSSPWVNVLACFRHPVQLQSLLVMFPLSIITAILASAGLNPMFFPLIWAALLPLIVIGFQRAAGGAFSSPKLVKGELIGTIPDVLQHFLLLMTVFVVFMQLFSRAGIFPAMMFICLTMAILPALIAIVLLSGRMRSCLNPGTMFSTAQALGEAYPILAVFLPIFFITILWAGSWLGNAVSSNIEMFFLSLAVNYFTFVCYLLVGCTIFYSQKELAAIAQFKEYFARDEERTTIDAPRIESLRIVDQLMAEDRVGDALDYLEKRTETVFDLQVAQRYYDLLKAHDQKNRLLEHAKLFLDLLASENKEEELCSIYLDCQFEDPRFAPSPPTLFKIARFLHKKGQWRESVSAFYQFATAYQQSTYAPKALFLAATTLNEQLNEPEKAVSVLKDLVNSFPDYSITREARGYLKAVMKKVRRMHVKHYAPVYELRAVK